LSTGAFSFSQQTRHLLFVAAVAAVAAAAAAAGRVLAAAPTSRRISAVQLVLPDTELRRGKASANAELCGEVFVGHS
jgi:hypothetical protein